MNILNSQNLVTQTFHEIKRSRILWHAPKLAYFFFLSIFPLLICLVLTLGIFLESSEDARTLIENYLRSFAPSSASELVSRALYDVIEGASRVKISFTLIFTLWAASRGMTAIIEGMNSAYDIGEERKWWKRNLISLGLTLSMLILVTTLFIVILYTSPVAETFLEPLGVGAGDTRKLVSWLEWPSMLLLAALTLGMIYKFGPAKKQKHILSAVIFGLILWVSASVLFQFYLGYFDRFSVTYGFLSSVMILMIWLYLTGLSVLLGASFNVAWRKTFSNV